MNVTPRGFGHRLGFGRRPAVVVVDFIRAFTDPGYAVGADFDREVAATARLLEGARTAGAPVIFTTVAYQEGYPEAPLFIAKVPALRDLREGTPAVEVDDRLNPRPSEAVIVKKFASAFFGTTLHSQLTAAGVDTVIIAGCTTSGCVRATAVDALQHGFRPMVVRECVGDRAAGPHEANLLDIQTKYGDVVALDAALRHLAGEVSGE